MKSNHSILILFVVLLTSCAAPKPFIFKGLSSIKVEKASFGKNLFNAQFLYENPNKFEVTLKKIDCNILLNNQLLTHYALDTIFVIPANASFQLPAKMEIELSSLLKNSVDILFNKPMKINVKGNATLSKGLFTKTLPIEFEVEQKLNLGSILSGSKY